MAAAVWSFIIEIFAHLITSRLISKVTNKKYLNTIKNYAASPSPQINLEKVTLRIVDNQDKHQLWKI